MHARKTARDALFPSSEDDAFFSPRRGDVVFLDNAGARAFADRVNRGAPGAALRPAELAAMALVHEILHAVIGVYRERDPDTFHRLAASLEGALGAGARDAVIEFLATFPPPAVYRALGGQGDDTPSVYLERSGADVQRELADELILLWVMNQNPAYQPARVVVSDEELGPTYEAFVARARRFFDEQAPMGPNGETLVELLLAPSRAHPTSIFAQLDYIEQSWARALGLDALPLWRRRLALQDLVTEEGKWFSRRGPGPGEPLLEAMRFERRRQDEETARFSPDLGWMPNVVLLAKSVYVWLDQLTKKYGRAIHRLDQVPEEELALLASRGMNALWLIGLFERSRASRKIKQMRGDREALASAYSLKTYAIAEDLGGVPAYETLKARAAARGIRLAADMVPNHVGVDGDWVIQHPDWFLQTRTPPFPSYRFGGPDLSDDDRVGIFLEEGYWNKTDAAVVFRRHDRWTGEDRFIYHGNDGTSTPWNDTAQLDYLRADVRAAVIETILHVARMFPIIRFDAAMTLAKRHIQRLWFPLPGEGGAIPSRSDYAMTEDEFDRAIPIEFWREVVDAVAARAPGTLLLAEAFWMMEGYFVRTLGMHRVYNSAFMNMLKREENEKYRATIKNVLDFDPEILKRFVNFMNNPDEDTAIAQFGDDDKYFGVCVLMSTMPGLPMFGHGQIEGLHEKYGMEYRRARWDEQPNEALIRRHEREIFPLLHERHLFSDVEGFALYDFVTDRGEVDEDVYAYSNRGRRSPASVEEAVLVVFVNRFKATRGSIQRSTHRGALADELSIDPRRGEWLVLRDLAHGLEFLRRSRDVAEGGMTLSLRAFEYHVFSGFRPVSATTERPYDRLAAELAGGGVPDVEEAARRVYLRPIHAPLREACSKGHLAYLTAQLDLVPHPLDVHRFDEIDAPEQPGAPSAEAKSTPTEAARELQAARAALDERLSHVADGLDWMISQRTGTSVAIPRARALETAAGRLAALGASLRAAAADASSSRPDTELLLAWIQLEAVLALLAEEDHAVAATPSLREHAVSHAPAPAPAPEPGPGPGTGPEPELRTEPERGSNTRSGSKPGWEPKPAPETASGSAPAPAEPSSWSDRESLLAKWELATPLVEAFSATVAPEEARRRAALVALAATLPMGALAPAMRLALGAPRGQTFLNVHEADGVLWLVKERYEELARFLAEREAASGRVTLAAALAEADALAEIARTDGYRAEPIASRLGPPPDPNTPLAREDPARAEGALLAGGESGALVPPPPPGASQ